MNSHKNRFLLFILALSLAMFACNLGASDPTPVPTPSDPTPVPTPSGPTPIPTPTSPPVLFQDDFSRNLFKLLD